MSDDLLYGYESSMGERILSMLIGQSPYLLAYIAVIIVAMIFIGKRTMPSLFLAIGAGALLLWSLLYVVLFQYVWDEIYTGEMYPEDRQGWFLTFEIIWAVVRIASLACFTIAALGWRGNAGREGEQVLSPAAQSGECPVGPGPSRPISKAAFLLFIFGANIFAMLLLIPAYTIIFTQNEELIFVSLGLSCSAWLFSALSVVMGCVLHYKLWATIQDGDVRTTPGKAVGFLFIPFFNFYWVFQSVWGWAVDFNSYTSQRNIHVKRAPAGLVLAVCIIAVIPCANILAWPFSVIVMIIHFSRAISGANAIRSLRREHGIGEYGHAAAGYEPA
ncbi:MAG: hypothetical protein Phyf2KO_21860 [Phycisphaerales bacterium]